MDKQMQTSHSCHLLFSCTGAVEMSTDTKWRQGACAEQCEAKSLVLRMKMARIKTRRPLT